MKNARQTAILSIIEHNDIETQEDLAARLRDMGIMAARLVRLLRDAGLAFPDAEHVGVSHTLAGSANAAAEAIDSMRWPEILGTMAGDNTIFVAVRSAAEAPVVVDKFHEILQ